MSSGEIGKEEERRLIEKERSRESELKKRGGYVNKDGNYVINEENANFLRIAVQNGMIKAGSPEKAYANVEDAIKASDLAEEAKRKIYEMFSAKVDQIENDARRLYPDKKSERDAYVKRMKDEWWNDFVLPEHERNKNKPKSYDNQAVSRGNYVKINNLLM